MSTDIYKETKENGNTQLLQENLRQEYDDYRQSLKFIHECPACHYSQAMILLGVGFFSSVRLQFLLKILNWKQIFGYSTLTFISGSLGVYKMTYAYHVYTIKGRVKKLKDEKII